MAMEAQLDSIAAMEGWVLRKAPKTPKPEAQRVDNEFIVRFKEGVDIPVWIHGQERYGVELVKLLGERRERLWLIRYDLEQIAPRDMLAYLEGEGSLESVEFNYKTNRR